MNDPGRYARLMAAVPRLTRRDEDSGCLEWLGTMTGGNPRHGGEASRSTPTFGGHSVRRTILAGEGKPVGKGKRVTTSCGNPSCIEREHFVVRHAGVHAAIIAKAAWRDDRVGRTAAVVAACRARSKVRTMEMAQRIRDARTCEEAAAMAGISLSAAKKIRRGHSWKPAAIPASSIFSLGESLRGAA